MTRDDVLALSTILWWESTFTQIQRKVWRDKGIVGTSDFALGSENEVIYENQVPLTRHRF